MYLSSSTRFPIRQKSCGSLELAHVFRRICLGSVDTTHPFMITYKSVMWGLYFYMIYSKKELMLLPLASSISTIRNILYLSRKHVPEGSYLKVLLDWIDWLVQFVTFGKGSKVLCRIWDRASPFFLYVYKDIWNSFNIIFLSRYFANYPTQRKQNEIPPSLQRLKSTPNPS